MEEYKDLNFASRETWRSNMFKEMIDLITVLQQSLQLNPKETKQINRLKTDIKKSVALFSDIGMYVLYIQTAVTPPSLKEVDIMFRRYAHCVKHMSSRQAKAMDMLIAACNNLAFYPDKAGIFKTYRTYLARWNLFYGLAYDFVSALKAIVIYIKNNDKVKLVEVLYKFE